MMQKLPIDNPGQLVDPGLVRACCALGKLGGVLQSLIALDITSIATSASSCLMMQNLGSKNGLRARLI